MATRQFVPFDPIRLQDCGLIEDPERFPVGPHPYYITTPRYIRTSAGIKALHILCHCLNRIGHEAYLLIFPHWTGPDAANPDLLTPLLTPGIAKRHRLRGVSPILVYPEIIEGNPHGAHTIARYVLNFPGLLGGSHAYPPNEIVFGYSEVLAEASGAPGNVLFIPASDAAVFSPGDNLQERHGSCFWASKYQQVHNGKLLPETADSVEITRDLPDSPTPPQIAELFRRSEVFYAYENTALALEAALCLCPTVFLPNPWLTEVIATKEMGWDGFAWGTDPAEVARAKATVHLARERYLATYTRFWDDLASFVTVTQARAAADAATLGFPKGMVNRIVWRPRAELVLTLWRIAGRDLRREGPLYVVRRALPWTWRLVCWAAPPVAFVLVLMRSAVITLFRDGPGEVVRKARPWLRRWGKSVARRFFRGG